MNIWLKWSKRKRGRLRLRWEDWKHGRGTENKSKILRKLEIVYRESSARKLRETKKLKSTNQSMASDRLTRVNQDKNSIGHLPLLSSVHTATSVFSGVKVFHVSYGLWSPTSTTWRLDPHGITDTGTSTLCTLTMISTHMWNNTFLFMQKTS